MYLGCRSSSKNHSKCLWNSSEDKLLFSNKLLIATNASSDAHLHQSELRPKFGSDTAPASSWRIIMQQYRPPSLRIFKKSAIVLFYCFSLPFKNKLKLNLSFVPTTWCHYINSLSSFSSWGHRIFQNTLLVWLYWSCIWDARFSFTSMDYFRPFPWNFLESSISPSTLFLCFVRQLPVYDLLWAALWLHCFAVDFSFLCWFSFCKYYISCCK